MRIMKKRVVNLSFLRKKRNLIQKIQKSVAFSLRFIVLVAIFISIIDKRWALTFVTSLILFFTFLPYLIGKNYKVYLPAEFEFITILFIFTSLFMGDIHKYYTKFWWWDIVLHTGSGIGLGFAGFILLYMLFKQKKIKTSPILIALFSFCFAVAIGAMWEIVEFSMDHFFNLHMQNNSLQDTMWDLIIDCIGAFLVSIVGFIYIKWKKMSLFEKYLNRFIDANPQMFDTENKQ